MPDEPNQADVPLDSMVPRSRWREPLALAQVGVFAAGAAWAFGGNGPAAGVALTVWGAVGAVLTISALVRPPGSPQRPPWKWLVPLLVFDAFVVLSLFNPNYRAVSAGDALGYVELPVLRWPALPSTARPAVSLAALGFFNGVYLSAFNLVLFVRRRGALRALWAWLVANAAMLAVFGTVQKLAGAAAPFFSSVRTSQPYFFASFIYHNHWGAFALLSTAAALGLAGHHLRRDRARPPGHTPAPAALVAVLFLAVAIPLSASRSSSLLLALLLAFACTAALAQWRRRGGERRVVPVLVAMALLVAGGWYVYHIGRPVIDRRIAETRGMLGVMHQKGEYMPRRTLYRDSWALARERLAFGWGLGSYPTAFFTRNTQHHSPVDGLPHYFEDAHSDWLQSVAEIGLVGTALLLACALAPWPGRLRAALARPFPRFLLIGCSLLVLYAALEFPFGNRAVVILFWVAWFTAVQYARLDRLRGRPLRCSPS